MLALGVGAGWALTTVLSPPTDVEIDSTYTTAVAVDGQVESSISLNAAAEWKQQSVGSNGSVGVVTTILFNSGDVATQGQLLYTVNLRPTVVAAGDVPAFRAIGEGDKGDDVRQLQQMLQDTGFYNGAVDGAAGAQTASSVKKWQKSLDVEPTGIVESGDIIFVPSLPSRLSLNSEEIVRGKMIGNDVEAVSALSSAPSFFLNVTEAQSTQIADGTLVEILGPAGQKWSGRAGKREPISESSAVRISVDSETDAPLCGDDCDQVPAVGQTTLSSKVILVPATEGVSVPTAALVTTSQGGVLVLDSEGAARDVRVLASARGVSIVEGLAAGTQVRVPSS